MLDRSRDQLEQKTTQLIYPAFKNCSPTWQQTQHSTQVQSKMLLPMLHEKHNFAYGYKQLFSNFSASGRSWQHKAHIVDFNFYCKTAVKRCFPLVGRTLLFCARSAGLIFIKVIFLMIFLSIFKFCCTSNGFCTFFNLCSWSFFVHFEIMRFAGDQQQKMKP